MGSRLGFTISAAAVTWALGTFPVMASGGGAIEVAQPLVTFERIEICRVGFVMGRPHQHIPGYELKYLGRLSCVCDEMGRSVNRNAAGFLGIEAGYHPHHTTGRLFGDTLRVYMDLSELEPPGPELQGIPADVVIRAAFECILTTAYDCRFGISDSPDAARVPARYVLVEVRGSEEHAHLGGVFSFEELGQLPRKRFFRPGD
jgi:hypothetical protein